MRRALVTGGAGTIGSAVVRILTRDLRGRIAGTVDWVWGSSSQPEMDDRLGHIAARGLNGCHFAEPPARGW